MLAGRSNGPETVEGGVVVCLTDGRAGKGWRKGG